MKITIFFPEPGVPHGTATLFLADRGRARRLIGSSGFYYGAPLSYSVRFRIRQKNYLVREITIEPSTYKPLKLRHASSARGAEMGRSNVNPHNRNVVIKLRLRRLWLVDGVYDQWGAYWGSGDPIFCAWGNDPDTGDEVLQFVRAKDRAQAKRQIRENLPNAKFYN